MTKNLMDHSRIKHIAIKYQFIREVQTNMKISLEYCTTEDQIVDIFTKVLPRRRFKLLHAMLGVTEFASMRSIKV